VTSETTNVQVDVVLTPQDRAAMLLDDARTGLTAAPKAISPVWFYDERGSRLFDEITRLPEYYPTRAERTLLERHADEIAAVAGADVLVELGSGTSDKTRILLDAMARDDGLRGYVPLDVDEVTLRSAAHGLVERYPGLRVHGVVGDFRHHLQNLPHEGRRLVAFLGGTIGNLPPADRSRFLADLRGTLDDGDRFLLGADLVKDPLRLIDAYDDPGGVTAEFNRNALRVLARELGASIDDTCFDHVARWDPDEEWIEMRLRARTQLSVHFEALDGTVRFDRGEELRTEISAKFTVAGIGDELHDAGLTVDRTWEHELGYLLLLASPAPC
jgi:dimethylhistidine N-methyltransferase